MYFHPGPLPATLWPKASGGTRREEVALCGHHILCMLVCRGMNTYSNLPQVIGKINGGAAIMLVSGYDSVCARPRQGSSALCAHATACRPGSGIEFRNQSALAAVAKALNLPRLEAGMQLQISEYSVGLLRRAFAAREGFRAACKCCWWNKGCTQTADDNYSGVLLFPTAVPGHNAAPLYAHG